MFAGINRNRIPHRLDSAWRLDDEQHDHDQDRQNGAAPQEQVANPFPPPLSFTLLSLRLFSHFPSLMLLIYIVLLYSITIPAVKKTS
jgi:hypothetical protein